MKTKSKVLIASASVIIVALIIALICVSTMYIEGGKMIVGVDDIDDIAGIKIIDSPCAPYEEHIEVELDEKQISRFAYYMDRTVFKRIFGGYAGGGYNIIVTMKDGSQKEMFFGGNYVYYNGRDYQCYSEIGYVIREIFYGE